MKITASGQALIRCAAVSVLVAVLIGWFLADAGVFISGDAKNLSFTASTRPPRPSPTPTPTPSPPTLTLSPTEGRPGTSVHVVGSGYTNSNCLKGDTEFTYTFRLMWDGKELATVDSGPTGFSTDFKVPPAPMGVSGQHQVVGECGDQKPGATFSVPSPPPSPTLTLNPNEGRPGTFLHVVGSGYSPCADNCQVDVLWDGQKIGHAYVGSDGKFSADVSVPQSALPGNHQVVGSDGGESAAATFAVFAIELVPNSGRPGDFFDVEGRGFITCPLVNGSGTVDVYDHNIADSNGLSLALARNVPVSGQGTFSLRSVQMPLTAAVGNHEIDARCVGSDGYASALFTVTNSPRQPDGLPGQPPGQPLPQFSLPPNPPPGGQHGPPSPPSQPGGPPPGPSGPPGSPGPPPEPPPPPGHGKKVLGRAYLPADEVPSLLDISKVFTDRPTMLFSLGFMVLVWLAVWLVVLVVGFPAEIFNKTFEENRERINGWFSRWFKWIRPRRLRLPSSLSHMPSWVHLSVFGLVAAGSLIVAAVPDIGLDLATVLQAVGFLVALIAVVLALETPGEMYFRWRLRQAPLPLRTLPPALIVAVLLALLSRLEHFEPPYVYGLVAGYLAQKGLNREGQAREDQGRGALAGGGCLLAISLLAGVAWLPIKTVVDSGHAGFWWLLGDAVFATLFIAGLETAVFAMIPMKFLLGLRLFRWRWWIWAAAYPPVSLLYVLVLFTSGKAKELGVNRPEDVFKALILFIVFGVASLAFWLCLALNARSRKTRKKRRASKDVPQLAGQ